MVTQKKPDYEVTDGSISWQSKAMSIVIAVLGALVFLAIVVAIIRAVISDITSLIGG